MLSIIHVVALTSSLITTAWPPTSTALEPDLIASLERGAIVERSKLQSDVVRYTFAARVDGSRARIIEAARDMCAAVARDPTTKIRFLAPHDVEPLLKASRSIDDDAWRALPALTCQRASALDRVYLFVETSPPFPIPATKSLARQDVRVDDDGALVIRASQILGGLGGPWDNELRFLPMADDKTAYVGRGVYGVPPIIPSFIIEEMMKMPDDKNPQRKFLAWLRARARST